MRPSLTLITATLAFAATAINASPITADAIAERAPAVAVQEAAVDASQFAARSEQDLEARRRKHHKKNKKHHAHKKSGGNGKATFYTGDQLDAPACGGPRPSDNDMIAAVKQGSQFKCGDHITLHKGSKSVTVKVVDMCEGCENTHFDLSKAAFKSLAPLSEGVINGLNWNM
ncbi:unnamed protein product [Sympodiomycopsis kandeliae]